MHHDIRCRASEYFEAVQNRLCTWLEQADGSARFQEDRWTRPGGGGGRTRVLTEGAIFEKAGVNFSDVFGELDPAFAAQLPGSGTAFTATGVSLVLHPRSPLVPTVHLNVRFLTHGERAWFGGGADLTPYYPYREDVVHFHQMWKQICEAHAPLVDYAKLKHDCDAYFYLPHRSEARGVGGIFFDYLDGGDLETVFAFVREVAEALPVAYGPIIDRRRDHDWTPEQRVFQEYRRGRYVEFNLVHDRGTLFGLKTGGRTESILMSLPPVARFTYDYKPELGSREAELTEYWLTPRDWASLD